MSIADEGLMSGEQEELVLVGTGQRVLQGVWVKLKEIICFRE